MYLFKTSTEVSTKFHPEVKIVVRKMTEDRRDDLRIKLSVAIAKLNLRSQELTSLGDRTDDEAQNRRSEIMTEVSTIQRSDIFGIKLLWGIKAISGLAIDENENPATVAEWKKWPSELTEEVVGIVDRASGLAPEEAQDLSSPTTSGGQVDPGKTNDTTAATASASDSIDLATVDSTIQS